MKDEGPTIRFMITSNALAIILLILLAYATHSEASEYQDCYGQGYEAGYCHGKADCIPPIIPPNAPPTPAEQTSCRAGYNQGFVDGRRDSPEQGR
jgi:hypothetical protein